MRLRRIILGLAMCGVVLAASFSVWTFLEVRAKLKAARASVDGMQTTWDEAFKIEVGRAKKLFDAKVGLYERGAQEVEAAFRRRIISSNDRLTSDHNAVVQRLSAIVEALRRD